MRHPLTIMAAALVAACVVGGAWVGASLAGFPLSTVDLDRGEKLFEQRCASCHSVDPDRVSSFGPNLSRIGSTAANRVAGLSAESYILQSIGEPAAFTAAGETGVMPAGVSAGLDADEVMSIVGYLTTRDGTADGSRLVSLVDEVTVPEEEQAVDVDFTRAEAGRKLFLGKGHCIDCHALRKLPGSRLRAPNLIGAGRHTTEYLYECITQPGKHITPGYRQWTIVLTSGKTVTGRIVQRGENSISIMPMAADSGGLVTVATSDIETDKQGQPWLVPASKSPMPDNWTKLLTKRETELIVDFVKTLK